MGCGKWCLWGVLVALVFVLGGGFLGLLVIGGGMAIIAPSLLIRR
jgi:hypothetical protein